MQPEELADLLDSRGAVADEQLPPETEALRNAEPSESRFSVWPRRGQAQYLNSSFIGLDSTVFSKEMLTDASFIGLGSDKENQEMLTGIISIVMAVVSLTLTTYDFWGKFNAVMIMNHAMREMRLSPQSRRDRYDHYQSLISCMGKKSDDLVKGMDMSAQFYKFYIFATMTCARPDLHVNFFYGPDRCVKHYAAERQMEFQETMCNAQAGQVAWTAIDMMLGNDTHTTRPDPSCQCLPDHPCGPHTWCWVPAHSSCPDVQYELRGQYSSAPCMAEKLTDPEKAHQLQRSTCTICHRGYRYISANHYFKFAEGAFGPNLTIDLRNDTAREELKVRLSQTLADQVEDGDITDVPLEPIEELPEENLERRAYVTLIEWERLQVYTHRCQEFLQTLGVTERYWVLNEDIRSEMTSNVLGDDRFWSVLNYLMAAPANIWNGIHGFFSRAMSALSGQRESLLQEHHRLKKASAKAIKAIASGEPVDLPELRLGQCSDEDPVTDHVERQQCSDTAALAMPRWHTAYPDCKCSYADHKVFCGTTQVATRRFNANTLRFDARCGAHPPVCAQHWEGSCSDIRGAQRGWLQSHPWCHCKTRSHKVFCDRIEVADRNFNVTGVLRHPQCAAPYCAKRPSCSMVEGVKSGISAWWHSRGREVEDPRHPQCTCAKASHVVYCSEQQVAERDFNLSAVLIDPRCGNPRCMERGLDSEPSSALELASESRSVSRLPWGKIIDGGMSAFWFGLTYIYGTISTLAAYALITTAGSFLAVYAAWQAVILYAAGMFNIVWFTGWSSIMCPRVAGWIEVMDGIRTKPLGDDDRGDAVDTPGDRAHSCSKTIRQIKNDLSKQIVDCQCVARSLSILRGVTPIGSALRPNPDEDELQELHVQQARATEYLQSEVMPRTLCSNTAGLHALERLSLNCSRDILIETWRQPCRCDPAPAYCPSVVVASTSTSAPPEEERTCRAAGCSQTYLPDEPCQCDQECRAWENCCSDYGPVCEDRSCDAVGCNATYDVSAMCQCDNLCRNFGNCCNDYVGLCDGPIIQNSLCADMGCNATYDSSATCQCDRVCQPFGNCCPDYDGVCLEPEHVE